MAGTTEVQMAADSLRPPNSKLPGDLRVDHMTIQTDAFAVMHQQSPLSNYP